ncbi:MAG TPA: RNA 3'-terminal phosphate cyclase [Tepidisphaeraceae bacterium]|nr:RNA 3'-terminal phosphate cyclase [Tepidisphaeraceae bacterium]
MASTLIQLDGSLGEGGGQILRTALSLSMVTGRAFRIEMIRAGRPKPGLLRQHLTAVNAAGEICGATVDGAAISSRELTFSPGPVKAGQYTFTVGSAGSTTLVLQTVLPALMMAKESSSLTLEGGTHNPHAPPLDFLEKAFVPLVNRMGPTVHLNLERAGFYPAGGGRFFADIQPASKLAPLHLHARGPAKRNLAKAVVAALPGNIAKRELAQIEKKLGWTGEQLQIRQLPQEWGPGNILTLEIDSENVTEVFTSFGMKGVSAESVADQVFHEARRYLACDAPVGPHLADQLLLPIALAGGGSFVTYELTEHTRTNIQVIQRFLPVRFEVIEKEREVCEIKLGA